MNTLCQLPIDTPVDITIKNLKIGSLNPSGVYLDQGGQPLEVWISHTADVEVTVQRPKLEAGELYRDTRTGSAFLYRGFALGLECLVSGNGLDYCPNANYEQDEVGDVVKLVPES